MKNQANHGQTLKQTSRKAVCPLAVSPVSSRKIVNRTEDDKYLYECTTATLSGAAAGSERKKLRF